MKQTKDLDGQPEESTLNIDNLEEIYDLVELLPTRRLFHRTERWRLSMLLNLAKAPRLRSDEDSGRIKFQVYEWCHEDPATRITQQELAQRLGVSKQYVNRLVHRNVSVEKPQLSPPKLSPQPIAPAFELVPMSAPVTGPQPTAWRAPIQFETVPVNQFGQPLSGGSYHPSFRTPGPAWTRRIREPG